MSVSSVLFCPLLCISVFAQERSEPRSSPTLQSRPTGVEELVQRAIESNRGLLANRKQVDEARGFLEQAGLRPNPNLQTNLSSGPAVGNPGEGEMSVGLSYTFELGGKRDKRVNVASIGLKASEYSVAEFERQLRADVKARFAEALSAARSLVTVRDLLQTTEQTYRITEARRQQGEGPALDARLADVERNRLRSEEILFDSQLKRVLFELKALAGIDDEQELVLRNEAPVQIVVPQLDFIERALQDRPDIQAARSSEERAEAEAELERAQAVPNITASVGYTNSRSRFSQFGTTGNGTLSSIRDNDNLVGIGLTIPLPFRDRNQGNIVAADARKVQARLRRQFLEQTAKRELQAALARYEAAERSRRLFDERVNRQAEENLKVVRASYDLGEIRLTDVLTEQRRLIDTKRAYNDVVKEYQLSLIELERLSGGLR